MRKGGEDMEETAKADMRDLDEMRRAFAAAAGPPPAPERCPAPERIWAAAHGELPPAEAREVVDHTAGCPACAEDWRLAVSLGGEDAARAGDAAPAEEARPVRPSAPVLAFPRRRSLYASLAGLAAAACLLVAVVVQQRMHAPGSGIYREGTETELRSLLPAEASLPRERFLLRWSDLGPDATYDLQVSTQALQPVATRRDLTEPMYLVPADRLARLPRGTRLLWQVEATLPDGQSLTSETFTTSLR